MIAKSQRWQKTAIVIATAMTLGTWGEQASALSLGRLAVLSALGEPLRAEIEILDINSEESSSLRTAMSRPEAFRVAGLEYNPSLTGTEISLQQRADGRSYLRLTNPRPVNDPYVDLMLEANWSSGRIVRDFTMLFDPPKLAASPGVGAGALAPIAVPQVSSVPIQITPQPQPAPQAAAPAATAPTPVVAQAPGTLPSPVVTQEEPIETVTTAPVNSGTGTAPEVMPTTVTAAPTPVLAQPSRPQDEPVAIATQPSSKLEPVAAKTNQNLITVKPGDTAGKIAAAQKPNGVSLDQVLVAMQRNNPQAFVDNNINRVRSGEVLSMPDAQDAQATSPAEAKQIIIAQSRDFNEFRSKLASNAPVSQTQAPQRQASGVIESRVEEKKNSTATPDKLTLSKSTVAGQTRAETIAKELGSKEAASQADEIAKNIADLNKLSVASVPKPAASAAAPVLAAPAPVTTTANAAQSAAPALVAASAPAPAASTLAPTVVATAPTPPPIAPRASAPIPATPPAPAAVAAEPDLIDELLENPMVPAAAGGLVALLGGLAFLRSRQRKKNTQVDSAYLESRLQPDSFFGASGGQKVDTTDGAVSGSSMVYSPSQLDAADDVDPVAEADVYLAYGRDMQAEEILKEALRMHPSRVAIHMKLLEIYNKRRDPRNFESIAKAAFKVAGGTSPEWEHVCELGHALDPNNTLYIPGGVPANSAPAPLQAEPIGFASTITQANATPPAAPDVDLDLDFSLDEPLPLPSAATEPVRATRASISAPPAAHANDGAMDFNLSSLSLDMGSPSEHPSIQDDPLGTKLALAQEFSAIGDTDGARALIEEIIAEASGDMKAKAEKALSQLS